jgi:putative ABC transport system permease protein
MVTDLRQALRSLIKSPGFSALVIVVLAVGIGANTAIFSIVNGVLLEPLPFAGASRLVSITSMVRGEEEASASFPDFRDWRAQSKTMDAMAAVVGYAVTMTGNGDAVQFQIAVTTADLFPMLGATPLLGRVMNAKDDEKGAEPVVLLAETTWVNHFGRRPSIVGESVTLSGVPCTVIGVMPAAFQFPIQAEPVEAWMPVGAVKFVAQFLDQRGAHFARVVGRLAPGTTIAQATSEMQTIAAQLAKEYPESNAVRTAARVHSLKDRLVREYRLGLLVLLSAVAAVLLIACANVANLLLARGTVRQKEMAIRAALGAPRARLVRQLLTESFVLAAAGGALGAVLALWGVAGLVAASPLEIPRLNAVRVDRGVLLFTTVVSMATGILFGLAPALYLSRADAGDTLKDAGRGSSGIRTARTRQMLVVAEIALSLVLLTSAGLLVRSLVKLQHVDPGFVAEHAVTTDLGLPEARYPDAASRIAFYQRLLDGIRTLPGAAASGIATTLPLSGSDLNVGFTIEGREQPPGTRTSAVYFGVSPDYFKAMGIRVLKGRTFSEGDNQQGPPVVIISDAFARKYWPNEDSIGKRLRVGINKSGPAEIVGLVSDVKQLALAETVRPAMYTPFPQTPWPFMSIVVRTPGDPAAVSGSLRAVVVRLDPDQALGKVKTVTEYVANSVATPRFTATLVGGFATLALLLAGFGLFSVMAYSVAQRRREIGIRMALGAQAADVRSLVVSQALRLGVIGLLAGLAGAFAAARVIATLLFGVSPSDPITFAGVCALLLAVLAAAAYLPARRATRVDPMIALRTE